MTEDKKETKEKQTPAAKPAAEKKAEAEAVKAEKEGVEEEGLPTREGIEESQEEPVTVLPSGLWGKVEAGFATSAFGHVVTDLLHVAVGVFDWFKGLFSITAEAPAVSIGPEQPVVPEAQAGKPIVSLVLANGATYLKEDISHGISFSVNTADATDELTKLTIHNLAWSLAASEITALKSLPQIADASYSGNTLTIFFNSGYQNFNYTVNLTPIPDSDIDLENVRIIVDVQDIENPAATNSSEIVKTFAVDAVADFTTMVTTNGIAYFIAGSKSGGNKTYLYSVNLDTSLSGTIDPEAIGIVNVGTGGNSDKLDFESLAAYEGLLYGFTTNNKLAVIDPGKPTNLVQNYFDLPNIIGESSGATFANGTLYLLGTSGGSTKFYSVNINDGTTTLIGDTEHTLDGLAYDTLQQKFYVVNNSGSHTYIYELNINDGTLSNPHEILGNPDIQGLSYGENDILWAVERPAPGQAYAINPQTWEITPLCTLENSDLTASGIENLAVVPTEAGVVYAGSQFTVDVKGTFGDYTDLSESHYFLVKIPDSSWYDGDVIVDPAEVPEEGTYVRVDIDPVELQENEGFAETKVALMAPEFTEPTYESVSFQVYAVANENPPSDLEPEHFDNIYISNATTEIQLVHGDAVVLGTASEDVLSGGAGDDLLLGYGGEDELFGEEGNDMLVGGPGSDVMTGGSATEGNTFVWKVNDHGLGSGDFNTDTITDFQFGGNDKLDLSDLLQGLSTSPTAAELTNYLHFDVSGSDTTIAVDINGSGPGDAFDPQLKIILEDVDATDWNLTAPTDQDYIQTLLDQNQLDVEAED